jgi:hypothetical protein
MSRWTSWRRATRMHDSAWAAASTSHHSHHNVPLAAHAMPSARQARSYTSHDVCPSQREVALTDRDHMRHARQWNLVRRSPHPDAWWVSKCWVHARAQWRKNVCGIHNIHYFPAQPTQVDPHRSVDIPQALFPVRISCSSVLNISGVLVARSQGQATRQHTQQRPHGRSQHPLRACELAAAGTSAHPPMTSPFRLGVWVLLSACSV